MDKITANKDRLKRIEKDIDKLKVDIVNVHKWLSYILYGQPEEDYDGPPIIEVRPGKEEEDDEVDDDITKRYIG